MTLPDGDAAGLRDAIRQRTRTLIAISIALLVGGAVAAVWHVQHSVGASTPTGDQTEWRTGFKPPPPGLAAGRVILYRNVRAVLALSSGAFSGGVFTMATLPLLSFAATTQMATAWKTRQLPSRVVFAATLPHAPAEFMAIVLAGASGLSGAAILMAAYRSEYRLARLLIARAVYLLLGSLVLIVLAAVIEAYLTPLVLNRAL